MPHLDDSQGAGVNERGTAPGRGIEMSEPRFGWIMSRGEKVRPATPTEWARSVPAQAWCPDHGSFWDDESWAYVTVSGGQLLVGYYEFRDARGRHYLVTDTTTGGQAVVHKRDGFRTIEPGDYGQPAGECIGFPGAFDEGDIFVQAAEIAAHDLLKERWWEYA